LQSQHRSAEKRTNWNEGVGREREEFSKKLRVLCCNEDLHGAQSKTRAPSILGCCWGQGFGSPELQPGQVLILLIPCAGKGERAQGEGIALTVMRGGGEAPDLFDLFIPAG
jgi:hypothetical protein